MFQSDAMFIIDLCRGNGKWIWETKLWPDGEPQCIGSWHIQKCYQDEAFAPTVDVEVEVAHN